MGDPTRSDRCGSKVIREPRGRQDISEFFSLHQLSFCFKLVACKEIFGPHCNAKTQLQAHVTTWEIRRKKASELQLDMIRSRPVLNRLTVWFLIGPGHGLWSFHGPVWSGICHKYMVWSGGLVRPGGTSSDHISDAINETSNFLLDALDCGTESDSVDEISKFLQATAIRDRNANPLDWWNSNAGRFPHIAKLASDVLAVQPPLRPVINREAWIGTILWLSNIY